MMMTMMMNDDDEEMMMVGEQGQGQGWRCIVEVQEALSPKKAGQLTRA
jgi:hypothetical protein